MPFQIHVKKRLKEHIALHEKSPITELRGVTCHMGSQCYLPPDTSERAPALTPASKLVLDLLTLEGWKAELTYRLPGNAPAGSRTRDLSITSPTP